MMPPGGSIGSHLNFADVALIVHIIAVVKLLLRLFTFIKAFVHYTLRQKKGTHMHKRKSRENGPDQM